MDPSELLALHGRQVVVFQYPVEPQPEPPPSDGGPVGVGLVRGPDSTLASAVLSGGLGHVPLVHLPQPSVDRRAVKRQPGVCLQLGRGEQDEVDAFEVASLADVQEQAVHALGVEFAEDRRLRGHRIRLEPTQQCPQGLPKVHVAGDEQRLG